MNTEVFQLLLLSELDEWDVATAAVAERVLITGARRPTFWSSAATCGHDFIKTNRSVGFKATAEPFHY